MKSLAKSSLFRNTSNRVADFFMIKFCLEKLSANNNTRCSRTPKVSVEAVQTRQGEHPTTYFKNVTHFRETKNCRWSFYGKIQPNLKILNRDSSV